MPAILAAGEAGPGQQAMARTQPEGGKDVRLLGKPVQRPQQRRHIIDMVSNEREGLELKGNAS
jgi:hypothetical protein